MIDSLYGKILDVHPLSIVIGTSAGINFFIHTTTTTGSSLTQGEDALVFCDIAVFTQKAEARIYGFASVEERDLFRLLISVNGVGPTAAVKILSGVDDPSEIHDAILNKDSGFFKKIKGVGPKLADKIIFNLEGAVKSKREFIPRETNKNNIEGEVREALSSLGYKSEEIKKIFGKLDLKDFQSAEQLVTHILKNC